MRHTFESGEILILNVSLKIFSRRRARHECVEFCTHSHVSNSLSGRAGQHASLDIQGVRKVSWGDNKYVISFASSESGFFVVMRYSHSE